MPDRPKVGWMVLVDWEDTWHLSSGWHSRKAARRMKPVRIASVGFVHKATPRRLVLIANVGVRNLPYPCSGVTVIPWGCVRSCDRLK